MNQDFVELLKVEAAEISTKFKKASIEERTTPQEVADRREEVFKAFYRSISLFLIELLKAMSLIVSEDGVIRSTA